MNVGDKFHVNMSGFDYSFDIEVIAIRPEDSIREFELKVTNRHSKDSRGQTYKCSDTFIEVEKNWFTHNPRRLITPIL